ncbi:putative nucleotidyltransferase substrate binding domain-containing protein [Polynucleobacter sp. MWH-Braz-FAM2G]|uniref:putative nucleotidyltransferase substrate binding domain-containing protein n=1 Tax=Polynucleobacter sp. MWH-Braz-FAM2G TaxID=1855883 RepID=UPI001BFDA5D4|nr:putative nucleotidyltransferase substrate binding domain-containing protein [Polynucleobacter sp. MWH-Braz-FAM2G]QWD90409.1 cyclic nucleotide-binding domain-containing protein [Polynucleobacter sp. MWH-Braz-FAM2G]
MPNAFNFSASPFDCLNSQEQTLVKDNVDIAYFKEGEMILDVGSTPTHLFILIKGYVRQLEDGEEVAIFGPDDCFDGRGLVAGKVSSQFIASEEVVSYQLKKSAVNELISDNATFGALLFADLSKKLNALAERRSQYEINSLSLAQVSQAFLREAHIVEASTNLFEVVKIFSDERTNNVLVRDESRHDSKIGIFTTTSLQRAILSKLPLDSTPVGPLSNFKLITVQTTDHLYEALAVMIRHSVHRVIVMDKEVPIGTLEQVDLLSFIANSSSLVVQKILQAKTLEDLKGAAEQITNLISLLHRNGTKVAMIARLVQELNAKLFEKTWSLIASPELLNNSCLFVMGSEGRGEQILKTDQDNGLIIANDYPVSSEIVSACEQFSNALIEFGYPECPGKIMVNNPDWRMSQKDFIETTQNWLLEPTPDSLMNLAIFLDSHPICGNLSLLQEVKQSLFKLATDNQFLMARFASAIESFSSEIGWWNRLLTLGNDASENRINLKKAGIFAITHGIRSLALENHIWENSTADRVRELIQAHKIPADLGNEAVESLHLLMELRLKSGLAELETGRPVSGEIDVGRLSTLERDLLKDSLNVVKRFKQYLRQHFHLEFA